MTDYTYRNENQDSPDKIRQDQRKARNEEGLTSVMGSPQGRAFVWWMIESSGALGQTFHPDTRVSAFNEGKRALGLAILDQLKRVKYFDKYVLMLKEHQPK